MELITLVRSSHYWYIGNERVNASLKFQPNNGPLCVVVFTNVELALDYIKGLGRPLSIPVVPIQTTWENLADKFRQEVGHALLNPKAGSGEGEIIPLEK